MSAADSRDDPRAWWRDGFEVDRFLQWVTAGSDLTPGEMAAIAAYPWLWDEAYADMRREQRDIEPQLASERLENAP